MTAATARSIGPVRPTPTTDPPPQCRICWLRFARLPTLDLALLPPHPTPHRAGSLNDRTRETARAKHDSRLAAAPADRPIDWLLSPFPAFSRAEASGGIRATIAGVLLAVTIPSRVRMDGATFVSFTRRAIDEFEKRAGNERDIVASPDCQSVVHALEGACEKVETPLIRREHALHPWVSFFIMPVFALANAGVPINAGCLPALTSAVGLGTARGLIVGKQVGVTLAAWPALRSGIGQLPHGTTWSQLYAASWIAGVGFTMSLFIANLAFPADASATSAGGSDLLYQA